MCVKNGGQRDKACGIETSQKVHTIVHEPQTQCNTKLLLNLRILSPLSKGGQHSRHETELRAQRKIAGAMDSTHSYKAAGQQGLSFKAGLIAKMSSFGGMALQPEFISPHPRSGSVYSPKLSLQASGYATGSLPEQQYASLTTF